MAVVKGFRGLRYSFARLGDLNPVMAPPYDVISPEFQEKLYKRHPKNIVRLILGKVEDTDTDDNNRYTRSAKEFNDWKREGVLEALPRPSVYYYTQSYKLPDGTFRTRKGFIARIRIEELGSGSIHPHERTLSGPKADRLKLIKACEANLSCIFSLYPESGDTPREERVTAILDYLRDTDPMVDVKGDDGVTNKVWKVGEDDVLAKIEEGMKDKSIFIADGHHRYETALNYRNYMREQVKKETGKEATGEEPFNYVMMYFASMAEEGLDIFPIHRIIHSIDDFDGDDFLAKCGEYFDIQEMPFKEDNEKAVRKRLIDTMAEGADETTYLGLHIRERDIYYLLKLKTTDSMDDVFEGDMPDVYKHLDVSVLHALILGKLLNVSIEDQAKQKNIVYMKDTETAVRAGREETNQMTFFMNATKVSEVQSVSEAGLLMPQKSTYFYPKLLSGVVINPLSEED